jgi:hypothetical protein
LSEIDEEIQKMSYERPLKIGLEENYISDEGAKKISSFILENDYVKKNIISLNLSNNHLTSNSLVDIKNLLEACPDLKLDLSINYISHRELNDIIQSKELKKRINCKLF